MGKLSEIFQVKYANGKYFVTGCDGSTIMFGGVPTYSLAGMVDGGAIDLSRNYGAARSNRDYGLEVNADTGSNDLTGDTYDAAIKGRMLIGTTQTNASIMGILAALDVGTVDLSANYYALRGHLDFWGSCTLSGSSHVGAISAYLENEATTTVGAGQCLDGVDIYQVGAPSVNASGFNSAVNIRGSAWKVGVNVGSCTKGIKFVGTTDTGLDFSSMTVGTNAGDYSATLIYGGGTSGGHTAPNAPITFATANQHGVQLYLKSTANQFTAMEVNAYTSAAMAGTQWQYMCVAGEFTVRSLLAASVDNMWAIIAQAQILSTYYGPGTGKLMTAGLFKVSAAATSGGVAGLSAGIYIDTGFAKASTQGDFGIFLISNNSAGIPLTSALHIAGGMSYVFDFAEVMGPANGKAWDTTGAVTNTVDTHAAGWLAVRMISGGAAVVRYLQLFDSAL